MIKTITRKTELFVRIVIIYVKKYNKKTFIQKQQPKNEIENNRNRTLIIGFLHCGKIYLMNHVLLQKQEPIFIITKSLIQNPKIKAQTSDEIQLLNEYANITVVFDNMLLSKQVSNIYLFFTRGRHQKNDIFYISQSDFHLPKITIRNYS